MKLRLIVEPGTAVDIVIALLVVGFVIGIGLS